jgi:hypothetical protein
MSMVSTPEPTVVVSTNTIDLVRFLFCFISAIWVAAIVAAAQETAIFPIACHVRHSVATLDGTLRDMAGTSSSLPTVES